MVLFTRCCCCFRLNTGGLILGWLGIVSSLCVLYKTMEGHNKMFQLGFADVTADQLYVVAIVAIAIHLVASIALLNGCRDLNHYLLLPWMISEIFSMVYGMSLSLQSVILYINYEYYISDSVLAINLLNVIMIFLRVYWWMCVQSYYALLREQQRLRHAVLYPDQALIPLTEKFCTKQNKMGGVFII